MSEAAFDELIGKCLVIYPKAGGRQMPAVFTLEKVGELAGRIFLIGRQPENYGGEQNWAACGEVRYAWDAVEELHVFEDEAAFLKATGGSKSKGGWLFGGG